MSLGQQFCFDLRLPNDFGFTKFHVTAEDCQVTGNVVTLKNCIKLVFPNTGYNIELEGRRTEEEERARRRREALISLSESTAMELGLHDERMVAIRHEKEKLRPKRRSRR